MSFDSERASIEGRFQSLWNNQTRIAFADVPFSPNTGESYVRIYVKPSADRSIELGTSLRRTFGAIIVQCFAPSPNGNAAARRMADAAFAIFRGAIFNGVICRDVTTTDVGQSGPWYQFNLAVSYWHDDVS